MMCLNYDSTRSGLFIHVFLLDMTTVWYMRVLGLAVDTDFCPFICRKETIPENSGLLSLNSLWNCLFLLNLLYFI